MRTWNAPEVPALATPAPQVRVHDTATGALASPAEADVLGLYVCGITPYDATHLGHANTYIAFDLLNRAWRNSGHGVAFVQNVTDVDDPLLERADKVHVDWRELAERETELFRQDMEALRVLPPQALVGAVESIPLVIAMIQDLEAAGATYKVGDDVYYSVAADATFGSESGYDRETMLRLFAERGGDPETPGKKDALDPVLWRGERPGEPAWDSPFGRGRPGWHIECAAIAREHLGGAFAVQGGGSDLVFPHHEMCAGHAQAISSERFAQTYVHAGMVAYDGEKMSKSLGNLVFVSALRNSDVDPMAIRLALLRHHYRADWEWVDAELWAAVDALADWRKALALGAGAPAGPVVEEILAALAEDLDAPRATAAVDRWVAATLGTEGHLADTSDPHAAATLRAALDAALGLAL